MDSCEVEGGKRDAKRRNARRVERREHWDDLVSFGSIEED